jgi:exonuclease SbcC
MARWIAALPAGDTPSGAIDAGSAGAGAVSDTVDPALALGLVARLAASAPPRYASGVAAGSPFAIVRIAMASAVAQWRERAERIAHADAALTAAAATIEREAREADRTVAEHTARRGAAETRRDDLRHELAGAASRLEAARGDVGFTAEELRRLLSADPSRLDVLAERVAALDRAVDRTRAIVIERERQVAEHDAARPAGEPMLELADVASVDALAVAVAAADRRVAELAATLAADEGARARRAAALASVASEEASAEIDRVLGSVIGSHDGKLFRSFAQSLTLDSLLALANAHLEELAPRYQLERVPRHDLELQVIDRDLGSEIRSVQSLSGGESFLVSLALALGLSSMSAHDVRVRTLLIDEGFGTLDPATLDSALSVLDALQATGRQVGVISHVPALVERVGAHVRVVQRGGGRSEVIVA